MARLLQSITLLLTAALLAACGGGASGPPRNVVLISIDTLRADRLGCYGNTRGTSPNLDGLAEDGVVFTDVSATSPWTLPSHATLLTGLYPSGHGVLDHEHRMTEGLPTLAGELSAAGFQTMGIVNAYYVSYQYGFNRGFHRFEYVSEWTGYDNERTITNRGQEITDKAVEWLGERDGRPFFLFLHYYDTHSDYDPDPEYRERLVRPYEGPITGKTGQLVGIRNREDVLEGEDLRHLEDLYDAEVLQLDAVLGQLFSYLESAGLGDETLVVVTSDHGEEFMEHGSLLHGRTCYQEVIAIPLILAGPGLPGGARIETPASLIDVAPTILAALGRPVPLEMVGESMVDWWADPDSEPPQRLLFAEAPDNKIHKGEQLMVRLERYKVCYDRTTEHVELYHLDLDPGEQEDLSEREAARCEALRLELERFIEGRVEGENIGAPSPEMLEQLESIGYGR